MAAYKNNDTQRAFQRALIAGLMQKAGEDVSAVQITAAVNRRRQEMAREAAVAAGKSKAEIEADVREATVSVYCVRRDIREMRKEVQLAGLGGAAAFLDHQCEEVLEEIEATHRWDQEIAIDLEKSRNAGWIRTKGKRAPAAEGGGSAIEPAEIIRYRPEEGSAQAALYARIEANARLRAKLRAELRALHFGRLNIPTEERVAAQRTFAQAILDVDDPEAARAAALHLLNIEIAELDAASSVPLPADLVAMQRAHADRLAKQITHLREFVRKPDDDPDAEDTHRTFEIYYERVERAPSRQITAGGEEHAPTD